MSLIRPALAAFLVLVIAPLCGRSQDGSAANKSAAREAIIRRIDEFVGARIKAARHQPATLASDEEFVRRVYLDLTGAIPRVAETRAFLADERSDKRSRLIDTLLDSP